MRFRLGEANSIVVFQSVNCFGSKIFLISSRDPNDPLAVDFNPLSAFHQKRTLVQRSILTRTNLPDPTEVGFKGKPELQLATDDPADETSHG